MARSLESLIEYSDSHDFKRLNISFGVWDKKERFGKGMVYCFYKTEESQSIIVRTDKSVEHSNLIYIYLSEMGFQGKAHYRPKIDYEVEEVNHLEIFPGAGNASKPPTILYARDLICGVGISFYNEEKQEGTLFNLAVNSSCANFFKTALISQIDYFGRDLSAKVIVGLGTYDNDKLSLVKNLQTKFSEILKSKKKYLTRVPEIEISEKVEEYVSYFALDTSSGATIVERTSFSHEDLLKRINP